MIRCNLKFHAVSFFIGTLLTGFLLVYSIGCGPAKDGKTTLKIAIWGGPDEIEMLDTIVTEWQKGHPDVKVKLEHTPAGQYTNKLLIRIAGGTAPDVMFVEANIFVNFWAMDAFLDLRPFIDNDPQFDLNAFFPEIVQRFTVDGKVYCIPRDNAPFACVYYNKKLFDEAGLAYPNDDWDWSELLQKAIALTKRSSNDGMIGQYGYYGWTWQNFVYSNGGSIVDDVEKPRDFIMDQKEGVEGLEFYADLINKYKVCPSPVEFGNLGMGAQQLFMSGKLAMYQSGFWESTTFKNIKDFGWDVAMFPKGPTGLRKFGTGGSGYCVLKSTKHPELAWDVVKVLTSEKAQIELASMGLSQPSMKSIAMGEHFALNNKPPLNKGMLNEAVQYVVFEPFHIKWREINDLHLMPQLDLVFSGSESVEEAISKIAPEADKLLME